MYFARALRAAGFPIGPGKVLLAVEALQKAGIENRDDFYWALHSVFVNRRDQRDLFDQAFHIFWRNPQLLERMMQMLMPDHPHRCGAGRGDEPPSRRSAEDAGQAGTAREHQQKQELEIDARMTFLRARSAAEDGFRENVAGRAGAGENRDPPHAPADPRPTDATFPARPARRARRYARHAQGADALGRHAGLETPQPARPAAAAGHSMRHIRVDGALLPRLSAFRSRRHQRS